MDILAETFPKYELVVNLIAVGISILAVVFWIRLYRKIYRDDPKEARGWSWLFVGVLGVLLFNISSIYLIFITTPIFELMEVIGRTIVGISLTIGAYLLYAPMKKGFIYRFVPVKPVKEKEVQLEFKSPPKHFLERGHSYLVNEEKPIKSNEIFLDLVNHGVHGLYITRKNPRDVRKEFGLKKTPIIWLTREKSSKKSIYPRDLVELSHTIKEFIKRTDNGVVLLDGLEYLIVQNNYKEILKFIQGVNDAISLSNSRLIVPLDPSAVSSQELHLLRREMSIIRTEI
jgi:hypothetical protein